jgi:hypothetical protein
VNSDADWSDGESNPALDLCRAVRQGVHLLGLGPATTADLLRHVDNAELNACGDDRSVMINELKAVRYVLLEVADGPVAPFLADAAALIIGDGYGRIFS